LTGIGLLMEGLETTVGVPETPVPWTSIAEWKTPASSRGG
jgi:hypothetical protein